MEMLRTHEYGILLVRVGRGEGPHVFTFLITRIMVYKGFWRHSSTGA